MEQRFDTFYSMKMALTVEHVISMYRRSKQVQFLWCKKIYNVYVQYDFGPFHSEGNYTLVGAIVHSESFHSAWVPLYTQGVIILQVLLYTLGVLLYILILP